MRLRRLQVEGYRAIAAADVSLDDAVVIVAENDTGTSSLLEALALALGDADPARRLTRRHLHQGPGGPGPIRIRLTFEERDAQAPTPDAPDAGQAIPPRGAWLELAVEPVGRSALEAHWAAGLTGPAAGQGSPMAGGVADRVAPGAAAAPAGSTGTVGLAARLRANHPVVWIGPGAPVAAPRSVTAGGRGVHRSLVAEVLAASRALVRASPEEQPELVERGFAAARALLESDPALGILPEGRHAVASAIASAPMPGDPRVGRPRVTASAGTAAQRLAVLLFVGALVEAGPPERIAGAEPILVIEDPEAHLHPLTLTALWRVIERLRGQRVVTTHSEALLALTPLADLRRLTRSSGTVRSWQVPVGALDPDAARRFAYHVRQRRGLATFARCWLLIEGETEAWALPELARLAGYDLAAEGVVPVEFAQAGLEPLLIVADALGIAWHLLTDGDVAGARYAAFVRDRAAASGRRASLTRLDERDLEHTLFVHGFADVYLAHAGSGGRRLPAGAVIARAIERSSKPALALAVLDAAAGRGPDGVPPQLREAVEASIALARAAGLARAMPAPAPRPERGARGWRPPS